MKNKVVFYYTNGKSYEVKGDLLDFNVRLDGNYSILIRINSRKVDNHVYVEDQKQYVIAHEDLAGIESSIYQDGTVSRNYLGFRKTFSVKAKVANTKEDQDVKDVQYWSNQTPCSSASDLKVGDKVVLHKDAGYKHKPTNPKNRFGIVSKVTTNLRPWHFKVAWSNAKENVYLPKDLVKVL